jgi:hypothetical protein
LAAVVLGLVGWLAGPAAAAEWTAKPAANHFGAARQGFGYTVNPGGRVDDGIVISNHGTGPLRVGLRVTALRWVRLERDAVTVAPGESVEVPFALTLPADAAPGDHAGAVVAEAGGSDARIPLRLRVGGPLKPSLAVEHLRLDYAGTPNPFAKGDATVSYTIRNTGNAILSARQTLSVTGPFGRWAVAAPRIADAPALLPRATWKVSVPLHGVTPALRSKATVSLVALLTDAAGSTAPLAATETSGHAWTVPWALLLLLAVVVCGLVVAARSRRAFQHVRHQGVDELHVR